MKFLDWQKLNGAVIVGTNAGKNEILPIPLAELENTLLEQNPGY